MRLDSPPRTPILLLALVIALALLLEAAVVALAPGENVAEGVPRSVAVSDGGAKPLSLRAIVCMLIPGERR